MRSASKLIQVQRIKPKKRIAEHPTRKGSKPQGKSSSTIGYLSATSHKTLSNTTKQKDSSTAKSTKTVKSNKKHTQKLSKNQLSTPIQEGPLGNTSLSRGIPSTSGVRIKTAFVVLTRSPYLDKYCRTVIGKVNNRQSRLYKKQQLSTRKRKVDNRKKKMNSKNDQTYVSEVAASNNGITTASSPKRMKGSLSVRFKSWNWQKDGSQGRRETFSSSDEASEGPALASEKKGIPKQVVYTQDDQMLRKCNNCLLYIPVESFEQHRNKDCEALHLDGGKDYICSECLACYASQKFLARHKRECPKRSQSLSIQSRYPRSTSKGGLEGMYSVVWKCHCKANFSSAEELGKHRETCVSAQQYTATCPICNIRVMGGSRTLRYHMTQNHASLFMPEETSSSSVLGSLEGTSPIGVITTQTTNLSDLVKRLSREHAGANIRIVSVNPDRYKNQQKDAVAVLEEQAVVIEQDQATCEGQKNSETNNSQVQYGENVGSVEKLSWQNQDGIGEEKADTIVPDLPQAEPASVKMEDELAVQLENVSTHEGSQVVGADVEIVDADIRKMVDNGNENNQDDLKNLLVKAKALTKELEEKLATESGKEDTDKSADESGVVKKSTKKRKSESGPDQNMPFPVKKTYRSPAKSDAVVKQEVVDPKPVTKPKRRFSQVKCLDCQQVFDDYIELGRHKRTDCPVVISQHLSPDGNFTEKVDMFGRDRKAKQQKLDVVECYYCTLCSSKFKLRSQVYEHMRFEHKNKGLSHYLNYHCPYCPRVFQTTRQRHVHKLERHADIKVAPEDDFTVKETEVCSICFQVVPKWDKDKHFATNCKKNTMEKESDTFCQLCGVLLDSQEALKQHRQIEHLNAIHFRCGLCSRTFGHAVELRCHKVSHHTKNPRWEQNCTMLKLQETKKMSPGTRSVKIHISPCVEEVKSPTKTRESSPTKTSSRDEQKQLISTGQRLEEPEPTGSKVLPAKSDSIRIPMDGSPLALTPEQMKSLSKGQPIKLVLPKDADMKNLSFTVPGEDGKPKKYSLLPKSTSDIPGQKGRPHNREELSKLGASLGDQVGGELEKHESPQKELAAALGLRPRGNVEPTRTQHRPTRLRSGRTIDNKVGVVTRRKEKKQVTSSAISARVKSGLRSLTRGKNVITTARKSILKNVGDSQKKRSNGKESSEQQSSTKQKGQTKKETSSLRKARTPTRKEVKENPSSTSKGNTGKIGGRQSRMVTRMSKVNVKGLAPVQVLKPIGKDRVLCMRCNSILGSMEEVACHHCKSVK